MVTQKSFGIDSGENIYAGLVYDTLGCDLNSLYAKDPFYIFQKVTHDYAIKIPEGNVAVLPADKTIGYNIAR